MSDWTALGVQFWDWEPLCHLPAHARLLWLSLFTSRHARSGPPGLWCGSIILMAEVSGLSPEEVRDGLDKLLATEPPLIEFDQKAKLLRFCSFPDAHCAAHNGDCVKGWWNKFMSIPSCELRNAHIRTLRQLIERRAAERCVAVNPAVETAWAQTFATITIPAPRRRGVRRLADSDTSTAVQPSLFPSSVHVARHVPSPPADGLDVIHVVTRLSEHPVPFSIEASSSPLPSEISELNKIRDSDTLSTPTETETEIFSSSSPDPDLSSTPHASTGPPPVAPHLSLVPDCYLASPDELIALFPCVHEQWRRADDRTRGLVRDALAEVLASCRASGHAAEDLAMAGRWVGVRSDDVEVVEVPTFAQLGELVWLERAITLGREHERIRAAKLAALQQSREALGFA